MLRRHMRFNPHKPLTQNSVIPAQAGIQIIKNLPLSGTTIKPGFSIGHSPAIDREN